MRMRHIALAAGVTVAGWLAFFGDSTPVDGIAEPANRAPAAAQPTASGVKGLVRSDHAGRDPVILSLLPRDTLIGDGDTKRPQDVLFNSQTWTTPPPPAPPPKPAPSPPPTAPPLPFTYLGKKIEDDIWEVYLARGEQTFIVRADAVIDNAYRVAAIIPPTLSLVYLPLNQVQTLTIGGVD